MYLYLFHFLKALYVSKCQYDLKGYNLRNVYTKLVWILVDCPRATKYSFAKLSVCVYIHRVCPALFAFKLFFVSFMYILPFQLYVLNGRDCVLNSILLYHQLAKSGHYGRCLKMLLRWVLVKYFLKVYFKKKKKKPLFVGSGEFASANKEVALFDSLTVSVCKQTLSSRPGFLADQF